MCFLLYKGTLNFNSNVIRGVVYRPPDKDINVFITVVHAIVNTIQKENSLCYLIISYIPLISKPTRVTAISATFIDNIFTNNITIDSAETCSGILYSDISDYVPVFYIDNNRRLTYETQHT